MEHTHTPSWYQEEVRKKLKENFQLARPTFAIGTSKILPQVFIRWQKHSRSSVWSETGCLRRPTSSCSQHLEKIGWKVASLLLKSELVAESCGKQLNEHLNAQNY